MNLSFVLVCIASGGGDNYLEFFSGLISCCSLTSAFTLSTFHFIFPLFFFFWTCNYRDFLTLSLSIVSFLSRSMSAKWKKAVFVSAEQWRDEICFKQFQKVIVSPTFLSFSFFLLLYFRIELSMHFSSIRRLRETWKARTLSKTKYTSYAEHKSDFVAYNSILLCFLLCINLSNNKNLFSNPLFIVIKVTKIFM